MRVGRIARLRPECVESYARLHASIWPEVAEAIHAYGIASYSIFLQGNTLFSYYELRDGTSPEELARLWESNPACVRWEALVGPMQLPAADGPGNKWMTMEEVFHQD